MPPKYTQEQWNEVLPALSNLAKTTVQWGHAVLVNGESTSDIARDNDVTRQTVHAAIKRVRAVIDEKYESGLRPVLVWVTEDRIPEVLEVAARYGANVDSVQAQDVTV